MTWWAPIDHPTDRPPALADVDVAGRLRVVADAYGMTSAQRWRVVPTALRMASNTVLTSRAAAEADPVFLRWWEEGLADILPRREAWLRAEADRIDAAVRSG